MVSQVDDNRLSQRRVWVGLKLRVGKERQLQLIHPEFHQVEFRRDLVPGYDLVE